MRKLDTVFMLSKIFLPYKKSWAGDAYDTVREQNGAACSATKGMNDSYYQRAPVMVVTCASAPSASINKNKFDWRVLPQVGLNSSFTNDPNFNQWPRNETLHFSNLLECTINKTHKMSRPWKHEIQHAGMCRLLKIEFRNEMFHGPQKGARSNFKKKHKSFLPHK